MSYFVVSRNSVCASCTKMAFLNFIYFYFWLHWFFFIIINLFIYFWLCWVFVSVRGLSSVAASGDHSSSRCAGLSLSRPLLLRSTGSTRAGSVIVAHGPGHSAACGIPPRPGLEPVSSAPAGRPPNHCTTREALKWLLYTLHP